MFFKRGKKKQDTVQELKPVYKLSGQNNKIFIIENGTEREITYSEKVAGIEIKIQGNNNRVYLELPIKAVGSTITIDNSNAEVRIGSTFLLNNVRIICNDGNEQRVWIGAGTTMHNVGYWRRKMRISESERDVCFLQEYISTGLTDMRCLM